MSTMRGPEIERIGYFHGQLLAARDLQDDAETESLLRGMHVRALHNTWGVALGFEVSIKDDTVVQVGPGIAYDARGQEILSSHTLNVGLPVLPNDDADAWWFDLVIRRAGPPERSPGHLGCGEGVDPREEHPTWRWCLAGPAPAGSPSPLAVSAEARVGEDIPLVRCRVTRKPAFDPQLDFTVRRQAQGQVRPHVAGATVGRNFAFDPAQFAFTTTVSTAAGGFSRTPFYFARVVIPLLLSPDGTDAPSARSILGPFVSIRNAQRTSFRVDLRVARQADVILRTLAAAAQAQVPVTVTWLGIEPTGGCPPALNLLSALFLYQPLQLFTDAHAVMLSGWVRGGSNG